jgi:hypothetical protein
MLKVTSIGWDEDAGVPDSVENLAFPRDMPPLFDAFWRPAMV